MGVLRVLTAFDDVAQAQHQVQDHQAPMDPTQVPASMAGLPSMPAPDMSKLTTEGMQSLREAAFDKEDQAAALQWSANITELRDRCMKDPSAGDMAGHTAALEYCRTLANETMYMAGKYYSMWEQTLQMWQQMNHEIPMTGPDGQQMFGADGQPVAAEGQLDMGGLKLQDANLSAQEAEKAQQDLVNLEAQLKKEFGGAIPTAEQMAASEAAGKFPTEVAQAACVDPVFALLMPTLNKLIQADKGEKSDVGGATSSGSAFL